jgi:hypothetical protein
LCIRYLDVCADSSPSGLDAVNTMRRSAAAPVPEACDENCQPCAERSPAS